MEGLIYKENVGRLPPIPGKRRSRVSALAADQQPFIPEHSTFLDNSLRSFEDISFENCRTKISSPPVNLCPTTMHLSSELNQDGGSRNIKSPINRAQTRCGRYGAANGTYFSTNEPYQQLRYVIMQELAEAELQNNAIHDKLLYNEQEMGSMAKEISCLKNKISVLEEKLQKQSEAFCCCTTNCCKQLNVKYDKIGEKIAAIEGFLNQHGMENVDGDISDETQISLKKNEQDTYKNDDTSQWFPETCICVKDSLVDFDKLLKAIAELNIIAGEGESKLCYTKCGATFQRTTGVELVLYENGLTISDGPFRSYDEPDTQQFLQDILDGYFPSEFQAYYPDGVPLQVIDKHETFYEIPKKWTAFSGKGYKLGHGAANSGNSTISRLIQDY